MKVLQTYMEECPAATKPLPVMEPHAGRGLFPSRGGRNGAAFRIQGNPEGLEFRRKSEASPIMHGDVCTVLAMELLQPYNMVWAGLGGCLDMLVVHLERDGAELDFD